MKKYRDPFFSVFDDIFVKTHQSNVNVTKNDIGYILLMSVPGLTKDDLKITIKENHLSISFEKDVDNENQHFIENFTKKYIIPDDVSQEKIEGKVENGILKITLPTNKKKEFERLLSLN